MYFAFDLNYFHQIYFSLNYVFMGKFCLVILLDIQCGRPTHLIMLVVVVETLFNNVLKS